MTSRFQRLRSWIVPRQRWFALCALFSVFSVLAPLTGDDAWLGCLGFLGFLGFLGAERSRGASEVAS